MDEIPLWRLSKHFSGVDWDKSSLPYRSCAVLGMISADGRSIFPEGLLPLCTWSTLPSMAEASGMEACMTTTSVSVGSKVPLGRHAPITGEAGVEHWPASHPGCNSLDGEGS